MFPQNEKGYTERVAISKYNKERLRGKAKKIRLQFHPEERHRNITDNEMIGYILDTYCDEKTL